MSRWTPIEIGSLKFSPGTFCVMAGPCSIESESQFLESAKSVAESGASVLRGGMFKLRTNPESFQGLGREAFNIAKSVKQQVGLPFISEVTDPRQIGDLEGVVDAFQVGSRNMHNYALLKELGQVKKPILLKRGFSGLVDEWLNAADYVIAGGNEQVMLCERGIRTFEKVTRNTFDLNAIAYVKAYHSIPVIADPSHATGDSKLVGPMALAAIAAGADGLIIEVHPNPDSARSDGFQALNLRQFDALMAKVNKMLPIFDKKLVSASQ
jgi:3-deoxy-7-phosphoheptulonate synthase